ncbi:MAG: amino acid permease [Spirulina sp.]
MMKILRRSPQPQTPPQYNTFEGVFKPTLLTILGVIMYLRVGWVVGNAGLGGGLLVVLAAVSITFATGLSVASIATNTRLKAGGPYAMMSKALGVEIGGSIGAPLFMSQALAVAMYVFGFREGWLLLFPQHSPLFVDLGVFVVIFLVAYISAGLAFRIQYLVMVAIMASLISIFSSSDTWASTEPLVLWGNFPGAIETNFQGTNFWGVFAVFFPATTGIMSGVNMSGELENSRRSIPVGTLSAIAVSTIVYIALCWWVSRAASPDELVRNYTIMVKESRWGIAVLVGLLAATFSAALSSIVGAPRVLLALARDRAVPGGEWLEKLASNGEPRRALLVSGLVALGGLLLRDLNAIAPLITMFFLITYGTINLVVSIESSLGLMNFRPTFKLPRIIPIFGALACIVAMAIINATFSLVALAVVLFIYLRLIRGHYRRNVADVRSGIFVAIAEWAATQTIKLDLLSTRAWKPTVLVPVEDRSQLLGEYRLLCDLCQPEGSILFLGLAKQQSVETLAKRIGELGLGLRKRGIFTTSSILDVSTDERGIIAALQALQSTFFRPNVLFLRAPEDPERWPPLLPVFQEARRLGVGVTLFGLHPRAGLGRAEVINLWLRPQLDDCSMAEKLSKGSINLAILMALRLTRAWKGELNLLSVVETEEDAIATRAFIVELRDLARIPTSANIIVMTGELWQCVEDAPQADMDFIGLQSIPDYEFVQRVIELTGSSCLFMSDSGSESALA